MTTIYVCAICSKHTIDGKGWLIASNSKQAGQMVIRCPEHITAYALRKAGRKAA